MIRAPNHLGELVLALPALERAARAWSSPPLVQVVPELRPVLEMAGLPVEVLPLPGRRRVVAAAAELRSRAVDTGVLLTPSFSAALIFFLARIRERRGVRADGRSWMLTDPVDRAPLLRDHRVREYIHLVGAGRPEGGRSLAGEDARRADGPPRPRLRRLQRARREWAELAETAGLGPRTPTGTDATAGADAPGPDGSDGGRSGGVGAPEKGPGGEGAPRVGVVPGGNAPSRRWPATRYARLVERIVGAGCEVLVFGGGDRRATASVAQGSPAAVDLGGRTSLWSLAGGLESCDVVVGNDTGPMHLAAALGRPMVALWGAGDPVQTRPLADDLVLVRHPELPCVPCVENECPRSGPGYELDRARRECMRLIEVGEVAGPLGQLTGTDLSGGREGA